MDERLEEAVDGPVGSRLGGWVGAQMSERSLQSEVGSERRVCASVG